MCSLTLAATVATTLYGAYSENQAAKQQAAFQEDQAAYNLAESRNQAIDIQNKATFDENQQRRKVANMLSEQQVALAANGIDINSGSALLIQDDITTLGNVDALQIRENARLQADAVSRQGQLNNATTLFEADQTRSAGRSALAGGLLTAGGQVVSSKWYKNRNTKTTSKSYDINSSSSLNDQRYSF